MQDEKTGAPRSHQRTWDENDGEAQRTLSTPSSTHSTNKTTQAPSPYRPPSPPFPNSLRMLRIMTPRIQPQPTTKSRLPNKQLLRRPQNKPNQPPMNLL